MPVSFKHSLLGLGGLGIALALAGCGGIADLTRPFTTATDLSFGDRLSSDAAGGRYPAGLALYMADKLAEAGDYRSAVTIYRTAYQRNPDDPASLLGLGESLRRLGANVEAEKAYRLADARAPKNPDILRGHGNNLVALGRPKAALKQYRAALRLTPDDPRLFNGMGVALDLMGSHPMAQARYREGLKIAPDNASLRNNLGLSLVLSGNYADAIASLGKFAKGPEGRASHRQILALAYGFAGRMDRAAVIARMDLDEASVQNNLNYIASLRTLDDKARIAAVLGYSGKMALGNQMAVARAEEPEPLAVAALDSPLPPHQADRPPTASRQAAEPPAKPARAAPVSALSHGPAPATAPAPSVTVGAPQWPRQGHTLASTAPGAFASAAMQITATAPSREPAFVAPVTAFAPVAEPASASVPANPAPVSTLASAPEPAPIPVTDPVPVSDPAPAPIQAADPTLVFNPVRTREPAPDASQFAEIESPYPPRQATTEADDEAAGSPPPAATPSLPKRDRVSVAGGAVIVGAGDTVYALSRRHGMFARAIIEANGLGPPYHLRVGQRIVLPQGREHVVRGGKTGKGKLPGAKTAPGPRLAEVTNPARRAEKPPVQTKKLKVPAIELAPAAGPADLLTGIEIVGSTVYAQSRFVPFYKGLLAREVTLAGIKAVAGKITDLYEEDGYVLSQAMVPEQDVTSGVVIIRIVEGFIRDVRIEGQVEGPESLLRAYANKIKADRPIRLATLDRYVPLIEDLPGVSVRPLLLESVDEEVGAHKLIWAGAEVQLASSAVTPGQIEDRFDDRTRLREPAVLPPIKEKAFRPHPAAASVPAANPAPVSTLASAPEPAPVPVTDPVPVSDPAPAPIQAADPTLVSNPGRTMEPAPDATPVAGIESIVAPNQALGLETASADRGGPAPATMDEWAVGTITEGMDSPPPQSERAWTPESAAQAPSPMPVPVAHPAPGTEAVSAPEPGNADAPLAVNSGWCAADPAARRPWYLPAISPVVSICFDMAALPLQGAQPALDAASQPPARWNFASFTVEAPRARVPEEPAMSAPYFVGAKFLPFGA